VFCKTATKSAEFDLQLETIDANICFNTKVLIHGRKMNSLKTIHCYWLRRVHDIGKGDLR